jgi:protocatechuate 3,4-dioxygenase beta subunit
MLALFRRFAKPSGLSVMAALWSLLLVAWCATPVAAGVIEGRVLDAATDQLLPGVRVYYHRLTPETGPAAPDFSLPDEIDAEFPYVETNENGNFRIAELQAGKYRLHARAQGYYVATREAQAPATGGVEANFELQPIVPNAAGIIAGRVTDADTGEPIADASVFFAPLNDNQSALVQAYGDDWIGRVLTDDNGHFETPRLRPGRHVVLVRAEGYEPQRQGALVEPGAIAEIYFALHPEQPHAGGAIEGRVVNGLTNAPIAGAWVFFGPAPDAGNGVANGSIDPIAAEGPEHLEDLPSGDLSLIPHVRTDADGRFRIEDLRPGRYRLLAVAEGFHAADEQVEVVADETAFVDFHLRPRTQPRPGKIVGRVVDAQLGTPIGGADVFFSRLDDASAVNGDGVPDGASSDHLVRTRNDGRYEIGGLRPGRYVLIAWANGFACAHRVVEVETGGTTEASFALQHDEPGEPGAIEGRVVDHQTGFPIAGAFVFHAPVGDDANGPPEWSTRPEIEVPHVRTNAEGRYRIAPLRPGKYHLVVRAEHYHPAHADARVWPDQTTVVDFRLRPSPPVEPGVIEGRVESALTGDPIAGARVYYGPLFNDTLPPHWWENDNANTDAPLLHVPFVVTDNNGHYRIPNLRPGEYHLLVLTEGYHRAHRRVEVESGHATQASFELIPIVPPASGAIEGFVNDAVTSDPIAGARVYYSRLAVEPAELDAQLHPIDGAQPLGVIAPVYVLTDDTGHYAIPNLPPGHYHLLAAAEGYRPQARRAGVESNQTTHVDVKLHPAVPGVGAIFGTVIDARTLAPLADARVWVVPGGDVVIADVAPAIVYGQAVTDDNGHYRILNVPAGPVHVYAAKRDYRTARKAAEVPAGGEVRVDFALQPAPGSDAGHIKGTVRDALTEAPIAGAFVVLLPDDDEGYAIARRPDLPRFTVTNGDGKYGFRNIPAGFYRLVVIKAGYAPADRYVRVHAGQVTEANFLLNPIDPPPTGTLAGVVRDAVTSEPLAGARVHILVDPAVDLVSGDRWTARTDEEGYYEIENVPVGEYIVGAFKRGYHPQRREATIVEGLTTGLDFALEPLVQHGAVEGTVIDALTNEPIENALVFIPLVPDPFNADPETALHARTDENGHYRIEDVPVGLRIVVARARGYFPDAQLAAVAVGETTVVDFALIPWPPEQGLDLRVRAVNAVTGDPIVGCRLHVPIDDWTRPLSEWDDHGGLTDAEGWIVLNEVPPGDWALVGAAEGFHPRAMTLDPTADIPPAPGIALAGTPGQQTIVLEFQPATIDSAATAWNQYP